MRKTKFCRYFKTESILSTLNLIFFFPPAPAITVKLSMPSLGIGGVLDKYSSRGISLATLNYQIQQNKIEFMGEKIKK